MSTQENKAQQDLLSQKQDKSQQMQQQRENIREEGQKSSIKLGDTKVNLNPDGTYKDKNELIDKMSADSFPSSDPPSTY